MSLSALDTYLCEVERTQILEFLALAVLKYPMQDTFSQAVSQTFLFMKETSFKTIHAVKNLSTICIRRQKMLQRISIFYK